jgi:hypothetical protein
MIKGEELIMSEVLQSILYAVITAAVPVITTFLCKWLFSLYENNKVKIKNETVREVLDKVVDMLVAVVETTTSTYVKQLKKDGTFDEAAQQEAFKRSFEAAKKLLTEESVKIIAETYGDVDEYLTNKIEQLVEELKK